MCRFVAYVGRPITLEALLVEPEHSLFRQSWAPREQRHGVVNADGFGVGWWDLTRRQEPARYRRALPMWQDRSFASMAGVIASTAVVAAVRSATPPLPVEESGTPPFADGRYLFAHNGAIEGYPQGVGERLRRSLPVERAVRIEGVSDSELLFALALARIDRGASLVGALVDVVATVRRESGGRLNMVLCDGVSIAATRAGDSLYIWRSKDSGSGKIASEPSDGDPEWRGVPDDSLIELGPEGLRIEPL
jgi:glutamine amidotransferase